MPKTPTITRSEADIALRAYQIWEAEGKPDGKDFDFWLRAEAELSGPPAKKAAAKKAPAKKAVAKKAPAKKPAAKKTPSRKASPKKP